MTDQKVSHTKEPWEVKDGGWNVFSGRELVTTCGCRTSNVEGNTIFEENIANARRIVACVNACAGISTEDLENIGTRGIEKYICMLQGDCEGDSNA